MDAFNPSDDLEIQAALDGVTVELPSERRSLAAIRSYLEAFALRHQRILCALYVDGEPVDLAHPGNPQEPFSTVEGESMSLEEVPMQLIRAALNQTDAARARVQSAVDVALINDAPFARELWWNLAPALKEPLLTLALLPDRAFERLEGAASPTQLGKWQLQQLGWIMRDVDNACMADDPATLSECLESRVLPWLNKLHETLLLWNDSISRNSDVLHRA